MHNLAGGMSGYRPLFRLWQLDGLLLFQKSLPESAAAHQSVRDCACYYEADTETGHRPHDRILLFCGQELFSLFRQLAPALRQVMCHFFAAFNQFLRQALASFEHVLAPLYATVSHLRQQLAALLCFLAQRFAQLTRLRLKLCGLIAQVLRLLDGLLAAFACQLLQPLAQIGLTALHNLWNSLRCRCYGLRPLVRAPFYPCPDGGTCQGIDKQRSAQPTRSPGFLFLRFFPVSICLHLFAPRRSHTARFYSRAARHEK